MEGTCEVCGTNDVELQEKKTDDGQVQNVCDNCSSW